MQLFECFTTLGILGHVLVDAVWKGDALKLLFLLLTLESYASLITWPRFSWYFFILCLVRSFPISMQKAIRRALYPIGQDPLPVPCTGCPRGFSVFFNEQLKKSESRGWH